MLMFGWSDMHDLMLLLSQVHEADVQEHTLELGNVIFI